MTIGKAHKEYVLEQLHKEYLYDGIIPTSDQLKEDLATYQEAHPNFEEPLIKTTDTEVDRGEFASSSFIQTVGSTLDSDITVLTREIYRIAKKSQRFYDRWIQEVKRLNGFAKSLEQRVDSLLLLEDDSFGFFAHVIGGG